ncbi:MAG TPA: RcnB family protein [Caulobacteraceae bacterium]|jgi:Ni/Co efflux regulator RcnB|nr:RcnB family protein [Caulobacteraceae bacterium]
MSKLLAAVAVAALVLGSAAGAASAADQHGDQHGAHQRVVHKQWRQGGKIEHSDWNRGQVVDWRAHHLRQPPRGYEWREVDGNWVLAAVATGVIASVLEAR